MISNSKDPNFVNLVNGKNITEATSDNSTPGNPGLRIIAAPIANNATDYQCVQPNTNRTND